MAALAVDPPRQELKARLGDGDLHAPHLLDIEVLHAIRGLAAGKKVTPDRADAAITDFSELTITRYPHGHLRRRIWELRHNLTAYDATYVALAEVLSIPLVTADRRIASAAGHQATIEAFG